MIEKIKNIKLTERQENNVKKNLMKIKNVQK